ncbi:hypothetical protein [Rhizobium sp. AN80A]|uniref:GCG_CRPN prefix-to-repeats domain-containing protein n=1 Tax=Rhizobium sp. AN80A TaxID=3040673 RepID=UPI0024B32A98|nr:hypothetical protein [Rhizobium sp. AN80A]
MRKTIIAIAVALVGLGTTVAEAMPTGAVPSGATNNVVKVDYACGRGFHVTPWGECRPNWRRPPPPRYERRYQRDYGWGHRPQQRYGWRDDRGYRPPPPWARDGYRYRY